MQPKTQLPQGVPCFLNPAGFLFDFVCGQEYGGDMFL
jgi:hypothetical protein